MWKMQEKGNLCQNLQKEIVKMWRMRKIDMVSVMAGALECVTKNLEK